MPASAEGASPARWRQRAGGGHRWEREERCRLAKREQPQWVRDHGQELATAGRGKTHGGLQAGSSPRECVTEGRNCRGAEAGRGMPACGAGTAPASARAWTGIGHLRVRGHGWRLAMRQQPQPGSGIGHLTVRGERWQLASREQPQPGHDGGQEVATWCSGERNAGLRRRGSPSKGANMDRNGPSREECAAMPACEEGAAPESARRWRGICHLWVR